jgi:tripartite-type tricarboxylate transporter receptor subunit TctC
MIGRLARICFVALATIPWPSTTFPQGVFPTKPVKLLVPYPAGGTNDVLARIVSDKLQAKWGQPIVIENRTGAGGNIAAVSAVSTRGTDSAG